MEVLSEKYEKKLMCNVYEYINGKGAYQSEEGMSKRLQIFNKIKTCIAQIDASLCPLLSGSMMLAIDSVTSDIDVIVLGPPNLVEKLFVTMFVGKIISDMHIVPRVAMRKGFQVVSILYRDVSVKVDVVYAQLKWNPLQLRSTFGCNRLQSCGINDSSKEILRGFCLAERIKDYVANIATEFQFLARFIKFFAKKNGIYGNNQSVPAIAWLIMLMRVFNMNRQKSPLQKLIQFFCTYSKWNWSLFAVVWMEKSNENLMAQRSDSSLMEIRLPYYPFTNLTAEISHSRFVLMKSVLTKGFILITDGLRTGQIDLDALFMMDRHDK